MPYAIKNLVDDQAPSGRLVQGEEELEAGEILVEDLTPDQVWDEANKRLRSKTTAEVDAEVRDHDATEANYQAALTTLQNSTNPDTQALVKVLTHRGLL